MRLIDADDLKQELRKHKIESLISHTEEKNVFDIINEQPTAYDMEKVVAELEETVAKRIAWIGMKDSWCDAIEKAIDIVRNGGKE